MIDLLPRLDMEQIAAREKLAAQIENAQVTLFALDSREPSAPAGLAYRFDRWARLTRILTPTIQQIEEQDNLKDFFTEAFGPCRDAILNVVSVITERRSLVPQPLHVTIDQ